MQSNPSLPTRLKMEEFGKSFGVCQPQNKVKNFLWRSCKEAIPVKKSMMRRKILHDDTCDHCNLSVESVLHALWKCSAILTVWDSIPKLWFHHGRSFQTVSDLIIFAHEEGKNVNLLAMILWSVWYRRNQLRTTNKDYPANQVA